MDFRMYDFGRSDITNSCLKGKSTLNTAAFGCEVFSNFEQKRPMTRISLWQMLLQNTNKYSENYCFLIRKNWFGRRRI